MSLSWSDASPSKYLKKADINPAGQAVTIEKFEKHRIRSADGPQDKLCVKFVEFERWLPLNATNAQLLATATGAQMPAEAIGHRVELYVDPNVGYGGQIVGGIRIRPAADNNAPFNNQPAVTPPAAPAGEQAPYDDDIPF